MHPSRAISMGTFNCPVPSTLPQWWQELSHDFEHCHRPPRPILVEAVHVTREPHGSSGTRGEEVGTHDWQQDQGAEPFCTSLPIAFASTSSLNKVSLGFLLQVHHFSSAQRYFNSFYAQEAPRQLVLLSRFLTISFPHMIHFLQLVLCISAQNT